ncbi:MAG: tetratricopeptide repeat protein [Anaerolineales bacterium]|nr:tetratricopeptide repeat protein [Anaerolineales bacterium]
MTEATSKTKVPETISALRDELKQSPKDRETHTRLGWALFSLDQIDEAVETFQAAYEQWPDDIEVNYGFGLALKTQGQSEQALVSFKRAEEIEPDTVRASMMRQLAAEQKEYLLQKF